MAAEFLTYKGYPLVRCGNELYYGNMSDDYVVNMNITSTKKDAEGMEIADKVQVVLTKTKGTDLMDMCVKVCERGSLFEALDIANVWLSRELA